MSKILPILVLVFAATTPLKAAEKGVVITKIFGKEIPGLYKMSPSITELDNGDLYLVYYSGQDEYKEDAAVWGSRLGKGTGQWSPPSVIADTPYRSEGNPVVWQAPNGLVWLFYVQRYGATWSDSRIKAKISNDGTHTWSDSMMVGWELGMMVRAHPIQINDGDYLLPIYHETGHDPEFVGPDTTSLFLRYSPETHRWRATNRIHSRMGNLQPSVVQITDDYLLSFSRRGGGYEPIKDGYLVRSESHDGGRIWSEGVETGFPNPNGAISFIKLRDNHLLLVYNNNMNGERPLSAALSLDGGKTFPHLRDIVDGDNIFSYPTAIQRTDGKIHVVFISDERQTIMQAVFEKRDLFGEPLEQER